MPLLDEGFAVLYDIVPASECDRLAARVESIGESSAGSRCLLDHEWCRQSADDLRARLAGRFAGIVGLVIVQCTYFHKTPERNWLVAWHQDRSIPVASRVPSTELTGWSHKEGLQFVQAPDDVLAKMFAVRLHLDDSTPHNGPLRVIPGSHRHGTLTTEQMEQFRADNRETTCVVGKGGVVMMRPLLLHASSKSTSTDPRRVLHFLFSPPQLPHGLAWRLVV